jgi:hypothetical protein
VSHESLKPPEGSPIYDHSLTDLQEWPRSYREARLQRSPYGFKFGLIHRRRFLSDSHDVKNTRRGEDGHTGREVKAAENIARK